MTNPTIDREDRALRAAAQTGRQPRYVVRCGIIDAKLARRVAVWDCMGGWVCSTHSTLAAAAKRAAELNAKVAA